MSFGLSLQNIFSFKKRNIDYQNSKFSWPLKWVFGPKVRLVRFSYFPTNFGQSLWLPIWIWCFIRICSTIGYLFCYMEKQQNIEFWAAHYSKFQACIIKKDLSRDLTPTHWVPWFWKKIIILVWPYIKTMILSKDIFKNKNIS